MKEEAAKQASESLRELNMLQDIKNATIKEESRWHSVADGDLPQKKGNYLCSDGEEFIVTYYSRAGRCFHNILERYGGEYSDWIKYWMEIPILQDKVKNEK